MKGKDIKQLATAELKEKVAFEKDSLRKMKFAHAISPIENPMQIRATRKLIAKLETEYTTRIKTADNK